jgi:hypothetical protein
MKKIIYILNIIAISLSLSSCKWEMHNESSNYNNNSLTELIQSYDLWYVDIDRTTGTGNIPFISRAFTLSFKHNQRLFANNNIAGIGNTGNGYGIEVGIYNTFNREGILEINHDIDGLVAFEVRQISTNEIEIYNRTNNVAYILIGYQKSHFDFDKVFFENITYLLQEFDMWTKTYEDIVDTNAVFNAENHLMFYVDGNTNKFNSSEDAPNVSYNHIIWDYAGTYQVYNTSMTSVKELVLSYYINGSLEEFEVEIINDSKIRLINLQSNNIYEFEGHGYIQYIRPSGRPVTKLKKITPKHYFKQ